MSRLEVATERFSAALAELETRIAHRPAKAGSASEVAALKAERDRLLARLAALEEESSALAGLTEEVENRLDGAIAEIRSVLDRG